MTRWLALLLAVLAAPLSAARAEPTRVLVQRLEAVGIEKGAAARVEEALVFELGKRAALEVVSPAELEQTVAFAKTQTELGCDAADECMIEVRQKLHVQRVISGKVSRLGSDHVLTFGIIDLATQAVGKRVARNAPDAVSLLALLPAAVDELLGAAAAAPEFKLDPGEQLKLAVMPLTAHGVSTATADSLTQIVTYELNRIAGISVLSRDDIRAMLDKIATEGELGCTENLSCVVEIGAALGLSKLVTGTVGKLDDTYVIAIQLVDTRRAEVQNRVLESFEGAPDELKNAVKLSAYRLVGIEDQMHNGAVRFTFNVDRAQVRLGERLLELKAHELDLGDIAPGRYSLRVIPDPEDYYPLQTDVYVSPRGQNIRAFQVAEKPGAWYTKWWVWTLTGAVVAATATTVAVLATQSPSTGSGEVVFSASGR
jgi:TolB-like protein